MELEVETKTGFNACKECFDAENEGDGNIEVRLCKKSSNTCPPIPRDMADSKIKDYLQAGIDELMEVDMVNHPPHYNNHPSGIECIEVTEHMSFNIGSAVKYLWRVDDKDNPPQDIDKAIWYLNREKLKRRKDEEKEKIHDTEKT
jgi:hypothetical protein